MNIIDFDKDKFYLGSLCKRLHEWNYTGKTLRRKDNKGCPECQKEVYKEHIVNDPNWNKKKYQSIRETSLRCSREFHQKNPEYRKQYNQRYQELNRDRIKQQRKQQYNEKKEQILAANRVRLRKYYADNCERIRAKRRNKYKQNLDYYRPLYALYARKRRAAKQNNHHAAYNFEQIQNLYNQFNNRCAYCKSKEKLTLDHFIPLSQGGPDCLGNFIPACSSCNSSKHNADPMEWYKRQPFYSVKNWKKILKVLGKTESTYNQIPLL